MTAANGHIVLSLDQVKKSSDLQTEWVPIPEWAPEGAPNKDAYGFFVRSLNGSERATWQQKSLMGNGKNQTVNFQATTIELVALATVDADGKQIFHDSAARAILRTKNSAILERLADVAMRLSGIGEEELATVSGNSTGNEDSLTD